MAIPKMIANGSVALCSACSKLSAAALGCECTTGMRDQAARNKFRKTFPRHEYDVAALVARLAEARAIIAEMLIDDDVATEAEMRARCTWHDRAREWCGKETVAEVRTSARLEAKLAAVTAERDADRRMIATLQRESGDYANRMDEWRTRYGDASAERDTARAQLADVTRERDEARACLAEALSRCTDYAAQLAAASARGEDAHEMAMYIAERPYTIAPHILGVAQRYLSTAPAPPAAPTAVSAREHARNRGALDGADAQALEGALSATERERDKALQLLRVWHGSCSDGVLRRGRCDACDLLRSFDATATGRARGTPAKDRP